MVHRHESRGPGWLRAYYRRVTPSELDGPLEAAQSALIARLAPGTKVIRVRWSGGETQVLELGAGPPLILVHGGGDGAYEWVPFMPLLAQRHRVLAVDRPGHGLADPFDYEGIDLAAHAIAFLGSLLDALELETVDMLANSIGGWWCTVFSLDQPRRVQRLIIAGHPPGVSREAPLPLRMLGLPLVGTPLGRKLLGNPSREGNRKFWGQVLVAHPERLTDELLDVDVEHMRRNRDSALSLVRRVVGPLGVRKDVLLGERWLELTVPTLFILGDRDAFVSSKVEAAWHAIAQGNPNVRISRIPGAGHLPWLDEPSGVLDEIASFSS